MMRHYTFIDYATQGYIALVALIILVLHGREVPLWPWLVAAHIVGLGLIHWLLQTSAANPRNRVLDFLRHFYPVILYTGFYRETGELNQIVHSGFLDALFVRLDQHIFGLQPSLRMMEWLPYRAVSELMYASYFSYYLMIVGVGLALFFRNRRQFFHYVSVVSFVFYVCYLIYIFLPVLGPRIFYREFGDAALPDEVQPAEVPVFPPSVQGVFFHIMKWIYHTFEAAGAAFPSSHVAVALTTVYFSFAYLRRVRRVHLTFAVLLCISTVYCRYHYAVDVFAGVLTAAVLVPLANRLYSRFGQKELDLAGPRIALEGSGPAAEER